jgi:dolichyl-phosphate-mannose--protein O-mannosyl transferase
MEAWGFYGAVAILAITMFSVYFGLVGTKQQNAEKRDAMMTAIGITSAVMIFYTFMTFFYFTSNTEYAYPYLILMTGLNLLLSVGALSVSMINVSY